MRLQQKRALVTGASSGLGAAIAIRFAKEGADVAITGRRKDRLEETAATIASHGGKATVLVADHTQSGDNERAIEGAVGALGGLDILVNNAGIIGSDGLLDPSPDRFRTMLAVNLDAVYDLTHRAIAHLLGGRSPSIINLSSVAGLRPYPGLLSYCVSKAGLDMFTRVAALELAPKGIRVNAINPGVIVTELHRSAGMDAEQYAAFLARGKETHPLGRVGRADEVADLALFLASDESSFITGATHSIDGGRALTSLR